MLNKFEESEKELGRMTNKQRRSFRIEVYKHTKSLFYENKNLLTSEPSEPNSTQINSNKDLPLSAFTPIDTEISLIKGDCLEVALKLKEEGYNVALLNMASNFKPGGGVQNGSGAQEENLFRRSDYFRHLNKRFLSYPLSPSGGVYTPNVLIVKGPEADNYPVLERQVFLDMIAVAAIRHPKLDRKEDGLYLNPSDKELAYEKILTILTIGAYFGHDCIVLSAMGCGAYGNPPRDIAKLFKVALTKSNFAGRFKRVVFAIFDDANARKGHNPEGNVVPFAKRFGVPILEDLEELEGSAELADTKKILTQQIVGPFNQPNCQVVDNVELEGFEPTETSICISDGNFVDLAVNETRNGLRTIMIASNLSREKELMIRSDLCLNPIDSEAQALYYPGITVFKDGKSNRYALTDNIVTLDLFEARGSLETDIDLLRNQFAKGFAVAARNNIECIVLKILKSSNLEQGGNVVKEMLDSDAFKNRFKRVVLNTCEPVISQIFGQPLTDNL